VREYAEDQLWLTPALRDQRRLRPDGGNLFPVLCPAGASSWIIRSGAHRASPV